jgi:hypothetical protein
MGEEEPASLDSDTAAAMEAAAPEPEDAAVIAAHGAEGQSANGHQPSGEPAGAPKSDADPGD